jgi:GNAT superfamily N-acetyltransferase
MGSMVKASKAMTSATVRKLEEVEWPTYRELRLAALAESPDAFGSTLATEQGRTASDWAARLAAGATSNLDLPLIAQVHGRAAGLAWAKVDASDTSLVNVYQTWVAPEFRGQGLGRLLLRAAVDWARARNALAVCLSATCGDTPAMQLYTREGFKPVGQSEPLRPGSPLLSQPMRLHLGEGAI